MDIVFFQPKNYAIFPKLLVLKVGGSSPSKSGKAAAASVLEPPAPGKNVWEKVLWEKGGGRGGKFPLEGFC